MKEVTLLQSAIPLKRGVARHYETESVAKTGFDRTTGKVTEIHTPPQLLLRIHEVMHARHTIPGQYSGIRQEVWDIVEDCRLHSLHWPWRNNETPKVIRDDVDAVFKEEAESKEKSRKEGKVTPYADFATVLRQNAVYQGMRLPDRSIPHTTKANLRFAEQVMQLIVSGKHEEAAYMIEQAFFPPKEEEKEEPETESTSDSGEMLSIPGEKESSKGLERRAGLHRVPDMRITELDLSEEIQRMDQGLRLTSMGSRIHRPSLRRPILPQRIFMKRSPQLPGGSVLFDASGSMGVTPQVLLNCCHRAPAATIAFYSGPDDGLVGDLFIYAKEGRRASDASYNRIHIDGGNCVDGKALDWLMQQEGPRLFVTDRGFCGSPDALISLVRLQNLETLGEVKVYVSYEEFQKAIPVAT